MIGISLSLGLLNIVILLGYGLVEIPIKCYKSSSNEKRLDFLQYKVSEYQSDLIAKSEKIYQTIYVRKIKLSNETYIDN